MGRNDLCFCGSGKKTKKCHPDVLENSTFAKIIRNYAEFDKKFSAYNNEHEVTKCLDTCSACCRDYFFISENEFYLTLSYYLYESKNDLDILIRKADVVTTFFKEHHLEEYENLNILMPNENTYNERHLRKYFDDSHLSSIEQECPFLSENGRCMVYIVRPSICRTYGTTKSCEFIGNAIIDAEIEKKMYTNDFITNSKTNEKIIKRQYPIFYWISVFLNEPYRTLTFEKIKKFKSFSETQYFEFSKKISNS